MKSVVLNIIFLLLFSWLTSQAQEIPQRTITVTGESEITAMPDRISFFIEIENVSENLDKAKTDNDTKLTAVDDVLKLFSIDQENMEVSAFEIRPNYNRNSDKVKIENYVVRRRIKIVSDDLEAYDQLIEALINAGIDRFSQAEYVFSDRAEAARKARIAAMKKAKEKALQIAEVYSVKLGKVISITEGRPYSYFGGSSEYSNIASSSVEVIQDSGNIGGKVKVRGYVTVVFEMKD